MREVQGSRRREGMEEREGGREECEGRREGMGERGGGREECEGKRREGMGEREGGRGGGGTGKEKRYCWRLFTPLPTYLCNADFSLYILQSFLEYSNESPRRNGRPIDAGLVNMCLQTKREGGMLKA